jgi:hypothetical protein
MGKTSRGSRSEPGEAMIDSERTIATKQAFKIGVHTRVLVRCYQTACFSQTARSAVVTGTRAARSAGGRPPNSPIPKAHETPIAASEGVTAS